MGEEQRDLVYISVVGTHDPFGRGIGLDVEGPCLSILTDPDDGMLVHGEMPDLILLLVTGTDAEQFKNFDDKAKQTKELLEERMPSATVTILDRQIDPTDIELLDETFSGLLIDLTRGFAKCAINITGGTPALITLLTALSLWRKLPPTIMLQSRDPRYRREGEARITRATWTRHSIELAKEKALQSLRSYDLGSANDRLSELADLLKGFPRMQAEVEAAKHIVDVIRYWDEFSLVEARDALALAKAAGGLAPFIETLERWLPADGADKGEVGMASAIAFYGGLSRRFARGEFANVITRSRASIERAIRAAASKSGISLAGAYGLKQLAQAFWDDEGKPVVTWNVCGFGAITVTMDQRRRMEVRAVVDPHLGLLNRGAELHPGGARASRNDAKEAMCLAGGILQKLLDRDLNAATSPFGREFIDILVGKLGKALARE